MSSELVNKWFWVPILYWPLGYMAWLQQDKVLQCTQLGTDADVLLLFLESIWPMHSHSQAILYFKAARLHLLVLWLSPKYRVSQKCSFKPKQLKTEPRLFVSHPPSSHGGPIALLGSYTWREAQVIVCGQQAESILIYFSKPTQKFKNPTETQKYQMEWRQIQGIKKEHCLLSIPGLSCWLHRALVTVVDLDASLTQHYL